MGAVVLERGMQPPQTYIQLRENEEQINLTFSSFYSFSVLPSNWSNTTRSQRAKGIGLLQPIKVSLPRYQAGWKKMESRFGGEAENNLAQSEREKSTGDFQGLGLGN